MITTPKTIIFGINGFLGSHLSSHFRDDLNCYHGFRSKSNKLIIENGNRLVKELPWSYEALFEVIKNLHPKIIINAIALVNAEVCKVSPLLAKQANSEIPRILAIASSLIDAKLVHISTDAVFGQKGSFFKESDDPLPKSIYGKTKLQGELEVARHAPQHLIIRTNFFGHHKIKPTLFNYFYQNLKMQCHVVGYEDVVFNPLYVRDLVLGIQGLTNSETQGILHFVGDETISKFDFAQRVLSQMGEDRNLLSSQAFGQQKFESFRKLDLTLSSEVRARLYNCVFDINSGIKEAILKAKGEESEL